MIEIWSLVFDTAMVQILALYLNFKAAKNIHVLQVQVPGLGGHWRFLIGVRNLDHDLDRFRKLAGIFPNYSLHSDQISCLVLWWDGGGVVA